MDGYVTTLESILGKTIYELEEALGFSHGTLKDGYQVYALTETVSSDEFYWRDKTRYSDGWHADPSIEFGSDPNVVWQAQRQDELRAALGRKFNYDEKTVDTAIDEIMQRSLAELNQRTGPCRIVKVCPADRNVKRSFPNARSGNVPQWQIKRGFKKQFTLIGTYHGIFPGN